MTREKFAKFGITLMPETMKEINKRIDREGERSPLINKQLDRYFSLLERGRRELRALLSDNEMALILDALNGTGFFDVFSVYFVGMEIADAISLDRLDEKWGVDGGTLKNKMTALTDAQRMALVDAVQMWWGRVGKGEQPGYGEALAAKEAA